MKWLAGGLVLLCAGLLPAAAQYEDDPDLAEQDQEYYQRYVDSPERPPSDPAEAAAAFRARAEELIVDKNHRREVSRWYDVRTDDPRLRVDLAAALLDAFHRDFESYWEGRRELQPYDGPSAVFLFYSFFKYNQLLDGDFSRSAQRPKGHYIPALDVLTLHTDADAPGALADTLIHEAAHQMIDQRLYGSGHPPSLWISEGLASYFGYAYRDESGRFHFDQVGGKSVALLRGERPASSREPARRLRAFRDRARRGEQGPDGLVHAVLALREPPRFYFDADARLNYAVGWLAVHFLLHGDDGRHAGAFAGFLALDADGRGTPEALYAQIGMSRDEFGAALVRHARTLKLH